MGYFPSFAKRQYILNARCSACDARRATSIEKEKAAAELEYIKTNIINIIISRGVPAKYKSIELEAPNSELFEILNAILEVVPFTYMDVLAEVKAALLYMP